VVKKKGSGLLVTPLIFGVLWLWMAFVYHFLFFTEINKAAFIFAGLFLAEAILLPLLLRKKQISFSFQPNFKGWTGAFLIFFSLVIYPVAGYLNGHIFPDAPGFGLPCPTVIFSFGLFCWADKKLPWVIWVVPILWSLIGLSAVFSFGMTEDLALPVAMIISMILNARNKGARVTGNPAYRLT
jgi:hypothetical protein